ncbi:hypothetical protein Goe21_00060 [Bacillus phage vB_BsuM-Goe21]|nr:hypothetical protein Goe21_00060 [Bacillus phage vB_BsuM-Goe21]
MSKEEILQLVARDTLNIYKGNNPNYALKIVTKNVVTHILLINKETAEIYREFLTNSGMITSLIDLSEYNWEDNPNNYTMSQPIQLNNLG